MGEGKREKEKGGMRSGKNLFKNANYPVTELHKID
jgi:hypothetical protein